MNRVSLYCVGLADMVLEMNRPADALAEYEAQLKINPNRFNSRYGAGRSAEMAKQPDKAKLYFQQLVKVCAGGSSSRPELAYARGFLSKIENQWLRPTPSASTGSCCLPRTS